jgi:hypothetical protein
VSITEVYSSTSAEVLLTLGFTSFIFLILFIAVLLRMSLATRTPEEVVSNPDTQFQWSAFFSSILIVHALLHFSLHKRAGKLWAMPTRSVNVGRWEPLPSAEVGPGLQKYSSIPPPFIHSLFWKFCC